MASTVKLAINIDDASFQQADKELAAIDIAVRGEAINNAIRSVGRTIAKRTEAIAPQPGYLRHTRPAKEPYKDKEGPKALGDTVATKVINAAGGTVKIGIVGYSWPAGAHGHLVDMGHDLVKGGKKSSGGRVIGHVEPAPYITVAVDQTKVTQQAQFLAAIRRAIKVR